MKKTIIVAPYEAHRLLFKQYRKDDLFLDVKFLTLDDIVNNFTFPLTNEAIKYIVKRLKVSFSQAKNYLNIIRLLPKGEVDVKYDKLYSLKKELIDNELVSFNTLFDYELSNAHLEVHYYSKTNPYLKKFLHKYDVHYNENSLPNLYINEYTNNDDQLIDVFNQIEELLYQGVPSSKIFIYGLMEDDEPIFNRLIKNYHLNVNNAYPTHIYDVSNVSTLIYNFNGDISTLLSSIVDSSYKESIIAFFKEYYIEGIDISLQKMVYLERAKSLIISSTYYVDALGVISKPIIGQDEYVFVLNYAQGIVPVLTKDDDVIDDEDKSALEIPTSEEINVSINDEFALYLSIGHIYLCYPKQNYSNKLRLSPLASRFGQKIARQSFDRRKKIYSSSEARLQYANLLDFKRKYIYTDPLLDSYQKQLLIPYLEYDPSFKGVNHFLSLNLLTLSYSQVNEFSKCAYKYYLNHVLHLERSENTFAMAFGVLSHDILDNIESSLSYEELFDHLYKNNKNKFEDTNEVFLPRLKEEFKKTFDFVKDFEKQVSNASFIREKDYTVSLNDNILLTGRIDKLIISGIDNNHVTIIDYKSGSETFKEEDLAYGLSMQLPVYALIFSKHEDFLNKTLVGLAIEPLLNEDAKKIYEKDIDSFDKKLRFNGRFLADLSILRELDSYLENGKSSKYLTGVMVKVDGSLSSKNSLYTPLAFEQLALLAHNYLLTVGENILANNFFINPKIVKGKNISCLYCPYRDICFRTNKQFVFISNETKEDE